MQASLLSGNPSHGIKGSLALAHLPKFDLVQSVCPDYMHCVLEGVARQLADIWFGAVNSSSYIGMPAQVKRVDERLLCIKPPQWFTRFPRSIQERAMWKASEWKWWVLFYGAPCLDGILPSNYHNHFCLLVSAMHLLLKDSITREDISDAMGKLSDFVFKMQKPYGEASMTFNVHQLLHLPRSVVELSPLWAHSTFVFESGNGVLLKLISSANGVAVQVLERFVIQLRLVMLKNTLDLQPQVKEMCQQLIAPAPSKVPETRTLGRGIVCGIVGHEQKSAFIPELGFILDAVTSYQRIVVRGHLLHTTEYQRAKRTRNCTFKCTEGQF
ncbi:uncharacterized protein LOC119405351 [Rhipicephalus sanguineus]|uniref:uncharacterized protein LOC119405351 n=1 Tax=Rhipicephalus sanguineus TaxID=34632 RepID=UPI001895CACC|nr:uncharacterized protein LOC119405351 [Rhipicephalus sanguineus]XP_037528117.1 uncharacterized protein LOC119405351 [Rhipicephalus sanguineus]